MKIDCPFCGTRDHAEFTYKGDASLTRPDHSEQDLDRWNDYVFQRTNPKGAHKEYWHHTNGCRKFLIVERDTVTHKITDIRMVQGGGK